MAAPDPLHGNARLQSSGAGPPRLHHTTGAPVNDSTKFTILHVIGDNVGLPNKIAPDEDKVFVKKTLISMLAILRRMASPEELTCVEKWFGNTLQILGDASDPQLVT
ncbi:hypothetical protein HYC85_018782 [Camellia sinensis]|uniref:Uncharacterized protein n=1 Tax=Camellia sinensis TaxID=4442 RepID=A0A7J7GWS4_CAMSI|nr:hypothetical protein HYC85_018782 [Camellia sinensis]